MKEKIKIAIQGYEGSFHEEAAQLYFGDKEVSIAPCDSFDVLCSTLQDEGADRAVMAIENSIAGSILQNYRLLREHDFWIEGEIYLRIRHQLLVNKNTRIEDIRKVYSHPMAINQCLPYLGTLRDVKLIEAEDTALSAMQLAKSPNKEHACIASAKAGEITGLEIISTNIETHKHNYTRFFILSRCKPTLDKVDKASICIQIPDTKGALLKVLVIIHQCLINMSKLQSFPVLGSFRSYFFHIDVEFDTYEQYLQMKNEIMNLGFKYEELGLYKRADLAISKTELND